jgi:hypothetical protein
MKHTSPETLSAKLSTVKVTFENPGLDPTARDLVAAEDLIQDAREIFGPKPILLTPTDRLRLPKAGAAEETLIPRILELARRHKIAIPRVDFNATAQNLARAQRLEPLRANAETLANMATDAVLQARGDAWGDAIIVYGVLVQAARADVVLSRELASIKSFFSKRAARPKKAAEGEAAVDQNAKKKGKKTDTKNDTGKGDSGANAQNGQNGATETGAQGKPQDKPGGEAAPVVVQQIG